MVGESPLLEEKNMYTNEQAKVKSCDKWAFDSSDYEKTVAVPGDEN